MDNDLYSRQIGAIGLKTMEQLIKMKVFIYGMRGLGVEIAKNIILAGPNMVLIHDPSLATLRDLGSNFYLTHEHIGTTRRDVASLEQLKELNPYVQTDLLNPSLAEDISFLADFNVIVITEFLPSNLLFSINELARANKAAFIFAAALGISGLQFSDFGPAHTIHDKDGVEPFVYPIKYISNDTNSTVFLDENATKRHDFEDGHTVKFRDVKGMTEINDNHLFTVKVASHTTVIIGDTTQFSVYQNGGYIEQVKVPVVKSYSSLKNILQTFYNDKEIPDPMDFTKIGRNEQLHCCFVQLLNFFDDKGRLPLLNDEDEAQEFLINCKNYFESAKAGDQSWAVNANELDDKIVLNYARWASAEIVPITAFLGGIVAQEIVKFTGKFTPVNQFLHFDFNEAVTGLEDVNREPRNSRYDEQIAVFGNEVQDRLMNSKVFMIGAGALGCEFLKNFALMGVSAGSGHIVVSDNDNIEISNLNRQFLFRKDHVGKSKSTIACNQIKPMNRDFNAISQTSLVCPETEDVFNNEFWQSMDLIVNAVDNIKARKYIDNQATFYNKPLIDSGTLGTKAHLQNIIPHLTMCYNDLNDDTNETEIPFCTLRLFPSMIEHCIEWSREKFHTLFVESVADAKKFIEDKKGFYGEVNKIQNLSSLNSRLENMLVLLKLKQSNDFNDALKYAIKLHCEYFDHNIKDLTSAFPENYVDDKGHIFWSGAKRFPTAIEFEASNDLSGLFVYSVAAILSRAMGVAEIPNYQLALELASKIEVPEWRKKNTNFKVNESDPDPEIKIGQEEDNFHKLLVEQLEELPEMQGSEVNPEPFEKDDDKNSHVDFAFTVSNLRALNYQIEQADKLKVKLIAGKIVPALATTTAAITGGVALQICTLMHRNDLESFRNFYINLGLNIYMLNEPDAMKKNKDKDFDVILGSAVKAIPANFSIWDNIEVRGPKTVKQFIQELKENYKVDVSSIEVGQTILYSTIFKSAKELENKDMTELYVSKVKGAILGGKYLQLSVGAETEDYAVAIMPRIKYVYA